MTLSVLLLVGPSTGGIGTHVRDLVDELPGQDVDVTVVAHPTTVERFGLTAAAPWPRLRSRHAATGLREVTRLAETADVVHAHGFQAGLVAALAARMQRRRTGRATPFVVSLHNQVRGAGLSPRRLVGERAAGWVLRRSALATGASSDLVADALALGAPHAELAEVPSPTVPGLLQVDREPWRAAHRTELLEAHGIDPQDELVLALGRVAPQKRMTDVLAASDISAHPATTWALVGPGQESLDVGDGRTGRARLLGATDDVRPWLLAADVLVVPSEWEARALVVQEAMAAGTPVVATEVGGLPDLLAGVGVLLDPTDPPTVAHRIAAAVDELLADPLRASRLARAARERAASWDDPTGSARRWRSRYDSLAQ